MTTNRPAADPNDLLDRIKEAKRDRMAPWLIRELRVQMGAAVELTDTEPDDPNWRNV